MDPVYILNFILILVSLVLLAVAVYLLIIIHEARKSLRRINSIIGFVEERILRQMTSFTSLSSLLKEGLTFMMAVRRSLSENKTKDDDER